jgi:VIT1/CCC1 family predicted Fe2+/Mn2+ transporter
MPKTKIDYLTDLHNDEALHAQVYQYLSGVEKNAKAKETLLKLYRIETSHSSILQRVLQLNNYKARPRHNTLHLLFLKFLRIIFGITFAIKFMEYDKLLTHEKLGKAHEKFRFSQDEKRLLDVMEKGERVEDILANILVSGNPVLSNIRDVVFGMNDGLVEVLAATVGFGAALHLPMLVFIAGVLVALSGTLSMAGGAYLSTKYEKSIGSAANAFRHPGKSAFYTGLFYFCGAVFPLIPFALGIGGFYGIALAILLTAIVLTFTSSMIAIFSNQSIPRRVAESLVISLGAASATIALGLYARFALHITI